MHRIPALARPSLPFAARTDRRERRSAEIRARLFRAALHLFAERGYQQTTVQDITEAADLGKGTFFNYFPTKEHVLATYGEERVATIEHALEKAKSVRRPVLPILRELITNLAGQSSQSPELLRSIFAAHLSNAPILANLQKRQRRARRLVGELFALAQDSGEVRRDISAAELGRLTHLIFMGVTIAWSFNPDSVLRKTAEEVWQLLSPSLAISKTRAARKIRRRSRS
ncbi:MAG: TetR/AcrR family transcriptional regulator [Candidatus Acidiferrales bacterium]